MRKLCTTVLPLLLVAVLGACGGGGGEPKAVKPTVSADGKYRVGSTGDAAATSAVKAAAQALPVALSYDYRSLDKSLAAATKLMTPGFANDFTSTFDKTTKTMAVEKQAITSALVRGAGIVGSVKDNQATVLVYLDQVLVSSKAKKASDPLKVSQNRVHVSLRKVDGRWLVSDIEPF